MYENIRINNKMYKAIVTRLSPCLMKIENFKRRLPPPTNGFELVTDAGGVYGKYPTYTIVYKEFDDGYIMKDNRAV